MGTQQALLGYMFRNAAATSRVLAFSVGMQFVITLTNAIAGGIAIWLIAAPAALAGARTAVRRRRRAQLSREPLLSVHAR